MKWTEDQFIATEFDTAKDKATFLNTFTAWIEKGFQESTFSNTFYHALSQHLYGHIAEYNHGGFYGVWFSDDQRRLKWLRYAERGGAYGLHQGEPRSWLWDDVEHELTEWVRASGILEQYVEKVTEAQKTKELALLAKLKAKYEPVTDNDRELEKRQREEGEN